MNRYVIKRDGRKDLFDKEKIEIAIQKAFIDRDGILSDEGLKIAEKIARTIEKKIEKCKSDLNIEEIQDLVEKGLMDSKRKDVAKAYVLYREERSKQRQKNSTLNKIITEKILASNVLNQNANMDEHSFGGRRGEALNEYMKDYALKYCMSEKSKENHLNNRIYIHDLDSYAVGMHNCLSIPFDKLLMDGFTTRQTDIRPANSINTAFQLLAVIFQLQSLQQFGGCSATHLDWTMVPYVRKSFHKHFSDGMKYLSNVPVNILFSENISIVDDYYKSYKSAYKYAMDMTERELKQAVEGMYHNLNTLQSRSGNQLPFTSINYGTCTLPEGRMVIRALLNGSLSGVGKHHLTPIFPCGIFQCMIGVNRKPGDPNYDLFQLALQSTARRLYPNYANVDWSGNAGYDRNDPRTFFSTISKTVA